MKTQDLRKKSTKDLEKLAQTLREDIAQTGIDSKTAKENNVRKVRNQRKDLARVLTLLQEAAMTDNNEATNKKEDN